VQAHGSGRCFRWRAEQSQVQGTGMSLALSKGLMEANGGQPHGRECAWEGTTVTVELAAAAEAAPAQHR
jgi:signal transduction histidine kinase